MRTSVATPRGAEPSATPSCSASRSRLGSPTPGRNSTYTAKLGFHRPLISAGTTGGVHRGGGGRVAIRRGRHAFLRRVHLCRRQDERGGKLAPDHLEAAQLG